MLTSPSVTEERVLGGKARDEGNWEASKSHITGAGKKNKIQMGPRCFTMIERVA
jgi:hypothetical protein